MIVTTRIEWEHGKGANEDVAIRLAKIDEQVAHGLTDGKLILEGKTGIRTWVTVEAATAWIEYINTFRPAPSLAQVVIV